MAPTDLEPGDAGAGNAGPGDLERAGLPPWDAEPGDLERAGLPPWEAEPGDLESAGLPPVGGAGLGNLEPGDTGAGNAGLGDLNPGDIESGGLAADDSEPDGVLSGNLLPIGLLTADGRLALSGGTRDLADDQPGLAVSEPGMLAEAGRLALAWAAERRLGRSAACGIAIALTSCAAAWFSAGSGVDTVRGVAALWIGYLVLKAGQRLPAVRAPAAVVGWLTALGSCLAESVVYAGLAAGAAAERWSRAWPIAVAVLGLVGVRNLMSACSVPPGSGEHPEDPVRRLFAAALTMPLGGRVLLVGLVAPVWGARAALLGLLGWAIVAIGYGLAGRAAPGVTGNDTERPAGRDSLLRRLRDDGALARALGALVRGNLVPLPPALLGLTAIAALSLLGLRGLPGPLMIAPAVVMLLAAPGSAHPHAGRFDWLVPALLLGAQILYLSAIGRGIGMPGPVIFALTAVLLLRYADLASPGRPALLVRARPPEGKAGERSTRIGWEGRLLIAGLAAATGIATFAYLALTVYFGFLICARVMTTFVARQEEPARDRIGHGSRRKPPPASRYRPPA